MITITRCSYANIEHFVPRALSEHLSFAASTDLYAVYLGDMMIGMCGFIWKAKSVVFKNVFFAPEHRRQGYYHSVMDLRIKMARERGAVFVNGNVTKMALGEWHKRGAEVRKQFKNGITAMRIYLR